MKIKGMIWIDEIIDKLAIKHNVTQNEVVEVLVSQPYFRFIEKGHRPGENVYAALGQRKMVDISLYSLPIRKMDAQLFYQQEV